jgi:hypothetical protein
MQSAARQDTCKSAKFLPEAPLIGASGKFAIHLEASPGEGCLWHSNYANSVLKNKQRSRTSPTPAPRQSGWSNAHASASGRTTGTVCQRLRSHSSSPPAPCGPGSSASPLTAKPRSGRPATYTPPQGAAWIAPALTPPEHRGLPFASWTRERLEACLHAHKGMAITRNRLEELLIAEGLRWRTHAPGLGERVEPAFAPKRGGLPHSTPPHLQGGA